MCKLTKCHCSGGGGLPKFHLVQPAERGARHDRKKY